MLLECFDRMDVGPDLVHIPAYAFALRTAVFDGALKPGKQLETPGGNVAPTRAALVVNKWHTLLRRLKSRLR